MMLFDCIGAQLTSLALCGDFGWVLGLKFRAQCSGFKVQTMCWWPWTACGGCTSERHHKAACCTTSTRWGVGSEVLGAGFGVWGFDSGFRVQGSAKVLAMDCMWRLHEWEALQGSLLHNKHQVGCRV
jgi:hypothetical protein